MIDAERLDMETDLLHTYGRAGIKEITTLMGKLCNKHPNVSDLEALRWAKNEYSYGLNADTHGTGYDSEEEQRYNSLIWNL